MAGGGPWPLPLLDCLLSCPLPLPQTPLPGLACCPRQEEMGRVMRESFFALAEARYATGEFKHTVFDSVTQVWGGGRGRASLGSAGSGGRGSGSRAAGSLSLAAAAGAPSIPASTMSAAAAPPVSMCHTAYWACCERASIQPASQPCIPPRYVTPRRTTCAGGGAGAGAPGERGGRQDPQV